MTMRVLIVASLLLLLGCTAEHRAALAYADEQAKQLSETEAQVLMRAPCAMRIGAYWRVLSEQQRAAVDALCGK